MFGPKRKNSTPLNLVSGFFTSCCVSRKILHTHFILAQIIEQVSGRSYEDFLRETIFKPLGMQNTGADQYVPIMAHRAVGYVRRKDQLEHAALIYMPILTGGGNLYSTTGDLIRWDQALTEGKLISPASYRDMYTPAKENYGYGWNIGERFGRQEIRHSGGVPGFRALILRYPEERVCVVVLSNEQPVPNPPAGERIYSIVAHDLAAIVFGQPVETP